MEKYIIECVKDICRNVVPVLWFVVLIKVTYIMSDLWFWAHLKGFFHTIDNWFYCGIEFSHDLYHVHVSGVGVKVPKYRK